MAFTGDGRKLTGVDGTVYDAEIGTEIVGDGATPLAEGVYVVSGIGASSAFPAPASGGDSIRVGDPFTVRAGDSFTPAAGDNLKPFTLTELADLSSWQLPFTADEIETTTFADLIKTYEKGKSDASGSFSGVVTIGLTTGKDGFLRQFLDIVEQDGTTSYDVFQKEDRLLIAFLVANKNASKGDIIEIILPINIYGAGIGGDQGSAQTFDSNFKPASSEDVNPVLYRVAAA